MLTLSVKVKPGSSRDEIINEGGGKLLIRIKARPVKGAANKYLLEFLAREFNTSKRHVVIEKGLNNRYKKVSLHINEQDFNDILEKKPKK